MDILTDTGLFAIADFEDLSLQSKAFSDVRSDRNQTGRLLRVGSHRGVATLKDCGVKLQK